MKEAGLDFLGKNYQRNLLVFVNHMDIYVVTLVYVQIS